MDQFLIDYLKSGTAWVFVGSGPSIDAGYPGWRALAEKAIKATRQDHAAANLDKADAALQKSDFPGVFEAVWAVLGGARLRQVLSTQLARRERAEIYDLLARWPVPVYLTTNFDDELQTRLAKLGEHYLTQGNSEDHFAQLTPDSTGTIFKLHGDLRSDAGLVLTQSQYSAISTAPEWQYWRTKLTSVFQMNRVILVGHSLTDPHVKHILQAAQQGAGVHMPVCWITADATIGQTREYLERFRIRLVPYDNRDGTHRNLRRLVEQVSQFVPPRTSIRLSAAFERATASPLGGDAAAPGFFVFNKLASRDEHEDERCEVLIAALQATVGALEKEADFSLAEALRMAGWPEDATLEPGLAESLGRKAVEKGLFQPAASGRFRVTTGGLRLFEDAHAGFERLRERFRGSLVLRARSLFPDLTNADAQTIARDLDTSLTAYFREGGLTLATTLLAGVHGGSSVIPSSIVGFVTEASTRYDDLLRRQAFCAVSVDAFVNARSAEQEYLGRVSQGFFAFHCLGVFGEVARERVGVAKESVWILDSNLLIPVLALSAPTNEGVRTTTERLLACGIRLFTTESLFDEAWDHLRFARKVVAGHGETSADVIAAATGQTPYRKTNQFLQGFLSWQTTGGRLDWDAYVYECFGTRQPTLSEVKKKLRSLGVETITLQDWPGSTVEDLSNREECADRIAEEREKILGGAADAEEREDIHHKAVPEAEALITVKHERSGKYYVLGECGKPSQAWFISDTSILNRIEKGLRITWQPEAFLRFAATLTPKPGNSTDAFGTVLWAVAEAGVSLVNEQTVLTAFGGVIDAAKIKLDEQRQLYEQTLAKKYGASADAVLQRLRPSARPMAALQLTHEMLAREEKARQAAEERAQAEKRRGDAAEKQLKDLARLRHKLELKKSRRRRPKAKKRHL